MLSLGIVLLPVRRVEGGAGAGPDRLPKAEELWLDRALPALVGLGGRPPDGDGRRAVVPDAPGLEERRG